MMYRILLLLFLAIFCANCTNDHKDQLSLLLQKNEIKSQRAVFTSDGVFEFTGKKGTRIIVDPANLEAPSGKKIDSVELRLLELTTLSELIKNNVQTVSNGRWLASGGSFKIDFYSEGEMLRLKDGKSIEVMFPKIQQEEMQLFYGDRMEDGRMNWEADSTSFKDKRYVGYIKYPTTIEDVLKNRQFGLDSGYFDDVIAIDTLENVTLETFRLKANERFADSIYSTNDTLYAEQYFTEELRARMTEAQVRAASLYNSFYEAVSINKLGWINIDRFYPEDRDRSLLTLRLDQEQLSAEVFLLDPGNNTLVNLYSNGEDFGVYSEEIPINIELTVLAVGFDGKDVYLVKQPFMIAEDTQLELKLNKSTLEAIEEIF